MTYNIINDVTGTIFDNDSANIPLIDRVVLVTILLVIVILLGAVYGGQTGAIIVAIFTLTILTVVGIVAWYLVAGIMTLYIVLLFTRVIVIG